VELGVFLLAGQFPGMTQAHAFGGAVDDALAAERAACRTESLVTGAASWGDGRIVTDAERA